MAVIFGHKENGESSDQALGELCSICREPATHKIGEEIMFDDPIKERHNLIAYVCCEHFRMIFGPIVQCSK